jgi:hypothetical protein
MSHMTYDRELVPLLFLVPSSAIWFPACALFNGPQCFSLSLTSRSLLLPYSRPEWSFLWMVSYWFVHIYHNYLIPTCCSGCKCSSAVQASTWKYCFRMVMIVYHHVWVREIEIDLTLLEIEVVWQVPQMWPLMTVSESWLAWSCR